MFGEILNYLKIVKSETILKFGCITTSPDCLLYLLKEMTNDGSRNDLFN